MTTSSLLKLDKSKPFKKQKEVNNILFGYSPNDSTKDIIILDHKNMKSKSKDNLKTMNSLQDLFSTKHDTVSLHKKSKSKTSLVLARFGSNHSTISSKNKNITHIAGGVEHSNLNNNNYNNNNNSNNIVNNNNNNFDIGIRSFAKTNKKKRQNNDLDNISISSVICQKNSELDHPFSPKSCRSENPPRKSSLASLSSPSSVSKIFSHGSNSCHGIVKGDTSPIESGIDVKLMAPSQEFVCKQPEPIVSSSSDKETKKLSKRTRASSLNPLPSPSSLSLTTKKKMRSITVPRQHQSSDSPDLRRTLSGGRSPQQQQTFDLITNRSQSQPPSVFQSANKVRRNSHQNNVLPSFVRQVSLKKKKPLSRRTTTLKVIKSNGHSTSFVDLRKSKSAFVPPKAENKGFGYLENNCNEEDADADFNDDCNITSNGVTKRSNTLPVGSYDKNNLPEKYKVSKEVQFKNLIDSIYSEICELEDKSINTQLEVAESATEQLLDKKHYQGPFVWEDDLIKTNNEIMVNSEVVSPLTGYCMLSIQH
eukprot:Awhi_evm2s14741